MKNLLELKKIENANNIENKNNYFFDDVYYKIIKNTNKYFFVVNLTIKNNIFNEDWFEDESESFLSINFEKYVNISLIFDIQKICNNQINIILIERIIKNFLTNVNLDKDMYNFYTKNIENEKYSNNSEIINEFIKNQFENADITFLNTENHIL